MAAMTKMKATIVRRRNLNLTISTYSLVHESKNTALLAANYVNCNLLLIDFIVISFFIFIYYLLFIYAYYYNFYYSL